MSKFIYLITAAFMVLGLTAQELSAQDPAKAIVLINGDPFIVDLAPNGSILVRYQRVPNYFTSSASDLSIISDYTKEGLIAGEGLDFYQSETVSPTAVPSTVLTGEQYIEFSQNRAVLNNRAVDQIRTVSDAFQEGRFSRVTIISYHRDTFSSRVLAQNRSKAIADLLNTFGIPLDNIVIELPYDARGSSLSFVNLSFSQ